MSRPPRMPQALNGGLSSGTNTRPHTRGGAIIHNLSDNAWGDMPMKIGAEFVKPGTANAGSTRASFAPASSASVSRSLPHGELRCGTTTTTNSVAPSSFVRSTPSNVPPTSMTASRPTTSQKCSSSSFFTSGASSAGLHQQQQDFHRGLVSALHEVLRQQRNGAFPTRPEAAPPAPSTWGTFASSMSLSSPMPPPSPPQQPTPPPAQSLSHSMSLPSVSASDRDSLRASRRPTPTTRPNTQQRNAGGSIHGDIESAIKSRRKMWAERQWQQTPDSDEALRGNSTAPLSPHARHASGAATPQSASEFFARATKSTCGVAEADEFFALPRYVLSALKDLERQETVARANLNSEMERSLAKVHSEAQAQLERANTAILSGSLSSSVRSDSSSGDLSEPCARMTPVRNATIDVEELKMQGNKLYEAKKYTAAYRCYSQAIAASNGKSDAAASAGTLSSSSIAVLLTNRAATCMMLCKYDQCIRDCQGAVAADPTSCRGFARLARAYALCGNGKVACGHYVTALDLCSSNNVPSSMRERLQQEYIAVPKLEQALKAAAAEDFAAACALFAQAKPFNDDPPIRLAMLKCSMFVDPSAARLELTKLIAALEMLPSSSSANTEFESGSASGSSSSGSNASLCANLTTIRCDALVALGTSSFMCGQHYTDIALSFAMQCLAIRPQHRGASELKETIARFTELFGEASSAMRRNDFQLAADSFSLALQVVHPSNTRVVILLLSNRSEAYARLRDTAATQRDCTAILTMDPLNWKALVRRSRSYEEVHAWRSAVKDMEKAATVNADLASDLADLMLRMAAAGGTSSSDSTSSSSAHQQRRGSSSTSTRFDHDSESPLFAVTKTLYDVLGVPRSSDATSIRAQYRRLTLQLHPDKVMGQSAEVRNACEQRFKEVAHAYGVLSDAAQRAEYDASLR